MCQGYQKEVERDAGEESNREGKYDEGTLLPEAIGRDKAEIAA